MSEKEKEKYMAHVWSRIMDENEDEVIVKCHLLNFESKIKLGWPDPRKYL